MADKPPSAGEPLNVNNPIFSASAVLSWQRAAKFVDNYTGKPPNDRSNPSYLSVRVRNLVGTDEAAVLPQFSVVSIIDLIAPNFETLDEQLLDKLQNLVYDISEPVDGATIAILREPIAYGAVGLATIMGVSPAKLVGDAAAGFCSAAIGDLEFLYADANGEIEIITPIAGGTDATDTDEDVVLATVRLGGTGGGGSGFETVQAGVATPYEAIEEPTVPDPALAGESLYFAHLLMKDPPTNHWVIVDEIVLCNLDADSPLSLGSFYPCVQTQGVHASKPIYATRNEDALKDWDMLCTDIVTNVKCVPDGLGGFNVVPTILQDVMILAKHGAGVCDTAGTR